MSTAPPKTRRIAIASHIMPEVERDAGEGDNQLREFGEFELFDRLRDHQLAYLGL